MVLTNSDYTRELIWKAHGVFAYTSYLGADPQRFRPGPKGDAPVVLSVGELVPRKGHDFVIEAVGHLPVFTGLPPGGVDRRVVVRGDQVPPGPVIRGLHPQVVRQLAGDLALRGGAGSVLAPREPRGLGGFAGRRSQEKKKFFF